MITQSRMVAGASLVTILAAFLVVSPPAHADVAHGEVLGTTEAEISRVLVARGYEITEFEIEDDEIEVEVIRGGQEFEIELDPTSGRVLSIERDD